MKTPKNRKPFLKASGISVGLATFLVVGLGGCDGSNDSLATKQQKCKLQEYRIQHQDECDNITQRFGNTSVNNTNNNSHNSGSSWVPMWLMMNSMNNNTHNGYSYSSDSGTKSSGYFSSSSSRSTGSSGGHSSSSSGG